jgi:hypothetical protein
MLARMPMHAASPRGPDGQDRLYLLAPAWHSPKTRSHWSA